MKTYCLLGLTVLALSVPVTGGAQIKRLSEKEMSILVDYKPIESFLEQYEELEPQELIDAFVKRYGASGGYAAVIQKNLPGYRDAYRFHKKGEWKPSDKHTGSKVCRSVWAEKVDFFRNSGSYEQLPLAFGNILNYGLAAHEPGVWQGGLDLCTWIAKVDKDGGQGYREYYFKIKIARMDLLKQSEYPSEVRQIPAASEAEWKLFAPGENVLFVEATEDGLDLPSSDPITQQGSETNCMDIFFRNKPADDELPALSDSCLGRCDMRVLASGM